MKGDKSFQSKFRYFWLDYWLEFVYGAFLAVCVVVSFWLSMYIPVDLFEDVVNPVQYYAITTVCFYGAWLLFRHSNGLTVRRSWAVVLIVWGVVNIVLLVLRWRHITTIGVAGSNMLKSSSIVIGNLLGWLLYIYPTQILRPGWLNWWRALLQVMPLVLLGVIDAYVELDLRWLIAAYPICIFVWLCFHVKGYIHWCEDNFSSMENIDVQWLIRYLIMLFLVGVSYFYIIFSHQPTRLFTQQWVILLMLAYATEQILFRPDPWEKILSDQESLDNVMTADISSTSNNQQLSISKSGDTYPALDTKASDVQSSLQDDDVMQSDNLSDEMVQQLEKWMETEKPYLNPDFQLIDLRTILPMNRTYLSQFVNTRFGCPFFQWVNMYRLNEAERLMKANPKMKLAEVAARSGFSSPAVFSRTFAREKGMSPREWSNMEVAK